MLKTQTIITIDNAFRDLIKAQNYEKYVLDIISRSKAIFRDRHFTHISSQAHGECDFIDEQNRKYDAKLIFDKKQGQLIGDQKNEPQQWLAAMLDEKTEFVESIRRRDISFVANTQLYRIMKQRIESVKTDESVILFIPFPIVDDFEGSFFLQLTTDFLQAVYNKLVEDEAVNCQAVYFIYPSMEAQVYVLRDPERNREYIRCAELKDFITYNTRVVVDQHS